MLSAKISIQLGLDLGVLILVKTHCTFHAVFNRLQFLAVSFGFSIEYCGNLISKPAILFTRTTRKHLQSILQVNPVCELITLVFWRQIFGLHGDSKLACIAWSVSKVTDSVISLICNIMTDLNQAKWIFEKSGWKSVYNPQTTWVRRSILGKPSK